MNEQQNNNAEQESEEKFTTRRVSYRSESGNNLNFSVWNGSLSITVFGKQGGTQFNKIFDKVQLLIFSYALDTLIGQPAGSTQSMTMQRRNDDGKLVPDYHVNLIKDDRQVISVEIKGRGNNGGDFMDRFPVMIFPRVILNTEPFKPSDLSSLGVRELRQYLNLVCPVEQILTNRPPRPKQGGFRNNSGYSKNFRGNGGPKSSINTDGGAKMPGFEDDTNLGNSPF